MKSLSILLSLLICILITSVDSDEYHNYRREPESPAQAAKSLNQCKTKTKKDACEIPNQVNLERGLLPKVVEVRLVLPDEVYCSTYTCLSINENRILESLHNVQVHFNYGPEDLGFAGPLWISRPKDVYDDLHVRNLPGYYSTNPIYSRFRIMFRYIITRQLGLDLQAKAVSVCSNDGELCTIENESSTGTTIRRFGSPFDVKGSPALESIEIDFDRQETLPIRLNWHSKATCSNAFWFNGKRMDEVYIIIYESSVREDDIQINQIVKPVLFLDSATAECDDYYPEKPKSDYLFKGESVLHFKKQLKALTNKYLQNGGLADKTKLNFYPQWAKVILGGARYSGGKKVTAAVAFCKLGGHGSTKCSEYKLQDFAGV